MWHLDDSDERGVGNIAGLAFRRWGDIHGSGPVAPLAGAVRPPPVSKHGAPADPTAAALQQALRRGHPLFAATALMFLQEIVNARLFVTVRDQLNLTYDVSFEIVQQDRLNACWWCVSVTASPPKIAEATQASLNVRRPLARSPGVRRAATLLSRGSYGSCRPVRHAPRQQAQGVTAAACARPQVLRECQASNRISWWEVERARQTLLARHESDLKDNSYVLNLLTHLQAEDVPLKTADCLRDLPTMIEAITADDLNDAFALFGTGDDQVYTAIGTAGPTPPATPPALKLQGAQAASAPAPAAPAASDMMMAALANALTSQLSKAQRAVESGERIVAPGVTALDQPAQPGAGNDGAGGAGDAPDSDDNSVKDGNDSPSRGG